MLDMADEYLVASLIFLGELTVVPQEYNSQVIHSYFQSETMTLSKNFHADQTRTKCITSKVQL